MKTKDIKVLVACEESKTVKKAFRKLGVKAFSCKMQKKQKEKIKMTNIDELLEKLENQLAIAKDEGNWELMCYISGQISVVKTIKKCIKVKE